MADYASSNGGRMISGPRGHLRRLRKALRHYQTRGWKMDKLQEEIGKMQALLRLRMEPGTRGGLGSLVAKSKPAPAEKKEKKK